MPPGLRLPCSKLAEQSSEDTMAPAKVPNRFGTLRYRGLGPVLVRVWVLPSVEPSPQHEAYGSLGSATMIVFLVPKRLREHLSSMLFMVHQSVSCHTDKNSWFQLFEVVWYTYLYSIYMAKSLSKRDHGSSRFVMVFSTDSLFSKSDSSRFVNILAYIWP